jgi:hypothetical protein
MAEGAAPASFQNGAIHFLVPILIPFLEVSSTKEPLSASI